MARNGMYDIPDFRGVPEGVIVERLTETGAVAKLEFVPADAVVVVENTAAHMIGDEYDLLADPELDRL